MLELKVESDTLTPALNNLAARMADLTPLMKNVAGIMEAGIADNFEAQGPNWHPLSEVTIEQRKKGGHWPGKILQVTGRLANSVVSSYDATSAVVGTNDERARVLHFGAKKGAFGQYSMLLRTSSKFRQKSQKAIFKKSPVISLPWGTIPPRPFMTLPADAIDEITQAVVAYAAKTI